MTPAMIMMMAATIPPIAPPDMPPSLLAFAEVSFCVEDVDEEVAPEEDALAVGLTTIRGV